MIIIINSIIMIITVLARMAADAQMMSHFYSPLHHMYGLPPASRYPPPPADQKYSPDPKFGLEKSPASSYPDQKYIGGGGEMDPKFGGSGGGGIYNSSAGNLYSPADKSSYPESSSVEKAGTPPALMPGNYEDARMHYANTPPMDQAAAGGGEPPDVKPTLHHHNHENNGNKPERENKQEAKDFAAADGCKDPGTESSSGGGGYDTPASNNSCYHSGGYYVPGNGGGGTAEAMAAGMAEGHPGHPAYGGYSTCGSGPFGLEAALARPRVNKNKAQTGNKLYIHAYTYISLSLSVSLSLYISIFLSI